MKRNVMLIVSLLCILALAGCTKSEQKTPVPAQPAQTQPAATEEKTPEEPPEESAVQPPAPSAAEQEQQTPFLTAEWTEQAPQNAYRVHADDGGEKILLKTELPLKNVRITRVRYNEETKEYEPGDRIWWMAKWEQDRPILLEMKAPVEQAQMEISWEDGFAERERRLILPVRIFAGGTAEQSVLLIYYQPPLQPTLLAPDRAVNYDLNGDTVKETVTFFAPKPDAEEPMALLQVAAGTTGFEYRAPLTADCVCYMADLNGDGIPELYLSGTDAEGNARTYGRVLTELGLSGMELSPDAAVQDADGTPALRGRIETVADGILYLADRMELLGERTAHTPVSVYSGTPTLLDGVWSLDRENGVRLRKNMTVSEENGTKLVLAAGKTLYPVKTDRKSFVVLETDDGLSARVTLEPRENGWTINGEKDSDLFDLG